MRLPLLLVASLLCYLSSVNSDEDLTDTEIEDSDSLPTKELPDEFKVVSTSHGEIKGIRDTSSKGEYFYSFYGVPYAQPPTGERRFKDPVKHEGWQETIDGTKMPPPCPQIDMMKMLTTGNAPFSGEEDCLFLNIFVPAEYDGIFRPVLVFIHGGAYASGSASEYEPHDFMNEEVILVVLQYRLGILGFSSTEDSVMPGNLGLKDQTLALKWVQENVGSFGGDPLRVTLFGESAGAASVHFQILSHHSIGLFSRAILQSGTAICPWAQGGVHRDAVKELAKYFKCQGKNEDIEEQDTEKKISSNDTIHEAKIETEHELEEEKVGEDEEEEMEKQGEETENDKEDHLQKLRESEELLKCLQNVDVEELTVSIKNFFALAYFPLIFGPIVDEQYIPSTPEFLLKDGRHKRLELIIGITKDEGAMVTDTIFANEAQRMLLKFNFPFAGPLSMEFTDDDIAPLNMSIKAYDLYAKGLKSDARDANNLTRLYGDRHVTVCSDITAFMHHENNIKKKKNVFFYELHHRGRRSFHDLFKLSFGREWVTHGDDLFYLFPMTHVGEVETDESDSKLKETMVKMWTNFAEVANPTPDDSLGFVWEPFTTESPHHLVLKPEPYMEDDTRNEVREFWTSLPTQQNLLLFKEKVTNVKEWTVEETSDINTSKSQTKTEEEAKKVDEQIEKIEQPLNDDKENEKDEL